MYNPKINFIRRARNNFPAIVQTPESMNWIRALTKPVRLVYEEFKKIKEEHLYRANFNAQAMYLQAILNLRFDPVLWRIHVIDVPQAKNYIYRKEDGVQNFIYRKWNSAYSYLQGQLTMSIRYLYIALSPNSGVLPNTDVEVWQLHAGKHMVLRRKISEASNVRYVIFIHSGVTYSPITFTSVMDYYRFRGLKYIIKTYA